MLKEADLLLDTLQAVLHAEAFDQIPLVEKEDAAFASLFDHVGDLFLLGGHSLLTSIMSRRTLDGALGCGWRRKCRPPHVQSLCPPCRSRCSDPGHAEREHRWSRAWCRNRAHDAAVCLKEIIDQGRSHIGAPDDADFDRIGIEVFLRLVESGLLKPFPRDAILERLDRQHVRDAKGWN